MNSIGIALIAITITVGIVSYMHSRQLRALYKLQDDSRKESLRKFVEGMLHKKLMFAAVEYHDSPETLEWAIKTALFEYKLDLNYVR